MAINKKAQFFMAFEKIEKQEDGTMLVSGVASSEAVDSDGETITAEAMKAARPDYMKFGAIREMHQPIAAGSAIKCEVDAEGITHLEAKIVDASTILKIEEEVLKGFSVGGKITGRDPLNKSIITGIRLTEISVVDRPANPDAVFKLAKLEGDEDAPATLGELRKNMGNVLDFSDIINRIGWLAQSVSWEADYEGDGSPVPAALRDWLTQGGEIFQAMSREEIDELLATLPAPPTVEVMAMAAKLTKGEDLGDLAKAKFSATTKATLNAMHKAAMTAVGALADCWKDEEVEEADKAAQAADLQKAADLEADLQKTGADLTKAADDLAKAQTTIDTLTKEVAELKAQPAAPKGVINANSVVSKSGDIANPDSTDAALQKRAEEIALLPPEEQTRLLIKAIHEAKR